MRWRLRVSGNSLRLENCESLLARITNSVNDADDADPHELDYEDDAQPDGIHVVVFSGAPAYAGKWTGQRNRQQTLYIPPALISSVFTFDVPLSGDCHVHVRSTNFGLLHRRLLVIFTLSLSPGARDQNRAREHVSNPSEEG